MPRRRNEDGSGSLSVGGVLRRILYGTGLVAIGVCVGVVLGALLEAPRLFLAGLLHPVRTLDLSVQEGGDADGIDELEAIDEIPLRAFGELQGEEPRPRVPVAKPAAGGAPPPSPVADELIGRIRQRALAGEPASAGASPPPADPAGARSSTVPAAAPVASGRPSGTVVQVASFHDEADAERLVGELRSRGFDAFVSSNPVSESWRHRVRVSPGPGENADALEARLRARGYQTWKTQE